MPGIDYRAVKELVSMSDVLGLIGWRPSHCEPSADRGPCPVHRSTSERSRSFAANARGWYCHRCNIGGDQISLYQYAEGLASPYTASIELCRRLGRPIPWLPRAARVQRPTEQEEDR